MNALLRCLILSICFLSPCKEIFAVVPVADFNAGNQAICINNSTTFSNTSSGTITSYSWNFGAGANPATANTAGPHAVSYSTSGSKTITLTVSGPDGSSTMTRTNYINVGVQRIKLMSYNLLNYSDFSDTATRNPYFRAIIQTTDPDILVVQEAISSAAMNAFLTKVMNANGNVYAMGTFINGFDTDNSIFYKTSKFTFNGNTPIQTDLRDINEFRLTNNLTGDAFRIYSVHLKASTGSTNEADRAKEVDSLRKITNALPAGTNFITCGDFNIYNSNESAYTKLKQINANDDGRFIDPLTMTGTWNSINYAINHTQCTRDTALGTGGAFGGMNDRFDMILYSTAVSQSGGMTYVPGSMKAYGNDGQHYGSSIYLSPNTAVSQSIAYALYYASDHLPVMADFDFSLNNCQSLDIAPVALLSPVSPACASGAKPIQVRIKNTGLNAIDFAANNATVNAMVSDPSAAIFPYSKTLSSGTLAAGDSMLVTFDSTANMSTPGNYLFDVNINFAPDVNTSNNSLSTITITAAQSLTANVNPPGPLSVCSGTSATLAAASGTGYHWNTGETTQSISVSSAGAYTVNYTNANGCLVNSNPVNVSVTNFQSAYTVVSENMGSVTGTTSISTHEANNGFQNVNLTMSGTADVRSTSASSGYASASGGANIFITTTPTRNFIISGINTLAANNVTMSFGLSKSTTASNGSDLLISYSSDGINYSPLTFPPLATGTGTTAWQYVTINETIPSVANLRIQFYQNGSTTQYRIDDVALFGNNPAMTITPQGPTTFCSGGSVVLTASYANQFLWSNGSTAQSITVSNSGNYTVTGTSGNGCTTTSAPVIVTANSCSTTVTLKLFIDGLYNGNSTMKSNLNIGQANISDTITLQLADPSGNHPVLYQNKSLLLTDGTAVFNFPPGLSGNSYYFIIRHRNTLESWSAAPILINSGSFSYQFNDSQSKIHGNNQRNLNDGNFGLYSGDTNQDGVINFSDLNDVVQLTGTQSNGYIPQDLNGDGNVESTDYSIIENNLYRIVSRP
jgi:endonuclease/exonuclease/phosphatase family metal-dependent hydrolase